MAITEQEFNAMLKHIVLLPFKSSAKPQLIEEIFTHIQSLKETLPGILLFSHGENQSSLAEKSGYTHAYTMDFVDEEYYHHFLKHEKQAEIREKIHQVLEKGKESLVVNYQLF
jgi:hypothetical protein